LRDPETHAGAEDYRGRAVLQVTAVYAVLDPVDLAIERQPGREAVVGGKRGVGIFAGRIRGAPLEIGFEIAGRQIDTAEFEGRRDVPVAGTGVPVRGLGGIAVVGIISAQGKRPPADYRAGRPGRNILKVIA
jgi:hypothetical protein